MKITNEILAAYIDGTLPQNQVKDVRHFIATHPQELEQMVRAMDDFPRGAKEETIGIGDTVCGMSSSPLAASGAAFVAKHISKAPTPQIRQTNIQANLSNLLNEIS